MGLQNFLMSRLIENSAIGKKIQSGDNVSKKGQFALDATEKNPNIEDSMAEKIANLENETKRLDNSVKKVISLPNGASTGDGQIEDAKVGIDGESYDTLGDAIREQVKTYRDVDVSNSTPTNKARVWVNTSSNDTESQDILLPQVDDANISEENTWSGKKINEKVETIANKLNGEYLIQLNPELFELHGFDYSDMGESPVPNNATNRARYSRPINIVPGSYFHIKTNVNDLFVAIVGLNDSNIVVYKVSWAKDIVFRTASDCKKILLVFGYNDGQDFTSLDGVKKVELSMVIESRGMSNKVICSDTALSPIDNLNDARINTSYMIALTSKTIANIPDNYPLTGSTGYLEVNFGYFGNTYFIKQILTFPPTTQRWVREFNNVTNSWSNWVEQPYYKLTNPIPTTIHIGKGYEYETLRSGIGKAIETSNSTVYVHEGTYDLTKEFADEISKKTV